MTRKRGRNRNVRGATGVDHLDERLFRRLVETTSPSIAPETTDKVAAMCSHHKLWPRAVENASVALDDFLLDRITAVIASLPKTEDWLGPEVLRDQLLVRHFAEGAALFPHLGILDALRAGAAREGMKLPRLASTSTWREALNLAHDVHLLGFSDFDAMMIRRRNKRQSAVADAIVGLRRAGFQVEVLEGRGHLAESERARLMEQVTTTICGLGPLKLVDSTFRFLGTNFDTKQGRYHLVRRGAGPLLRKPARPVAMVLQLCAQNIDSSVRRSMQNPRAESAALIDLATNFAASLDTEPYEIFDVAFGNTGPRLLRFLRDVATYDGLFAIFQFRAEDVGDTLRSLFAWLDATTARSKIGFTIDEASLVAEHVLRVAGRQAGHFTFMETAIHDGLPGIPLLTVGEILSAFAHAPGVVNRNYSSPEDQTAVDFWFKPLLSRKDGSYTLLNRSWCAPAFYEALRTLVASAVPNTDTRIGLAFEDLVRRKCASRGMVVHSGKYKEGHVDGDCDLVLETDKAIILFELKKAGLTRKARSGSVISLLLDLSQSLLKAQSQLAQQELLLHQNGSIGIMSANGELYSLDRRGRSVERVAMTLLDFGSLQNRDSMFQIMDTLVGSRVSSSDPEEQNAVGKIHAVALKLSQLESELASVRPLNGQPFFNCWFLSFGQLLVMLDDATSNDSFVRTLYAVRHVSLGTLDFYYEYAQARQRGSQRDKAAPREE